MKTLHRSLVLTALLFALPLPAAGATTDLSTTPLSSASSAAIKPNILFILDDSLSMELDYLPDWAGGSSRRLYQTRNPDFNGITYDPEITYVPPKYFDQYGMADTTKYPSQTAAATANWTAVKNDGYNIQYGNPSSTMNLTKLAFYYTTVPGEYCTDKTLKSCVPATAPSAAYPEPAKLRWCKTAAHASQAATTGDCKAIEIDAKTGDTGYTYPRMPAPRIGRLNLYNAYSTTVSSIKVDNKEILSAPTAATAAHTTQAEQIADSINACSFALVGQCQVVGYRAEVYYYSGTYTYVYIAAPGIPANPAISVTKSGSMSIITSNFAVPPTSPALTTSDIVISPNSAPGYNLLTVITPSTPEYDKAASRSDCVDVADKCTYAEEMTNFANWWAYYRTRMQAMKTATSRAFDPIDDKYRIGYFSINNNTASDFQNISEFDGQQKHDWYDKLFNATPYRTDGIEANTPLRIALSNAGRLYAGKLSSLNGETVNDPVQYWCQDNVTILSTDGYWNEGKGFKIDGSTDVGEQDGYDTAGNPLEVRPMLDGGIPKFQRSTIQRKIKLTPTLATWNQTKTTQWQVQNNVHATQSVLTAQYQTAQLQKNVAQWQRQDWQLQTRVRNVYYHYTDWDYRYQTLPLEVNTGQLQTRSGHLQKSTKNQRMRRNGQLQSQTAVWQTRTLQLQQNITPAQRRTSSNGGVTWDNWTNVPVGDSCIPVTTGNNRVECKMGSALGWTNVTSGSCVKIEAREELINKDTDSENTEYITGSACQYSAPAWTTMPEGSTGCTSTPYDATANELTVLNPVVCQTTGGWWGWKNVSTCDATATTKCEYAYTTAVADPSCVAVAPSAGPHFDVENPVLCTDDGWTDFADTSETCTPVTDSVRCQYDWSGWTNVSSCTPNLSSGSSAWTIINGTDCQTSWSGWTGGQSTCTESNSGGVQTQCRYATTWSGWSATSSTPCSSHGPDSGPTYSAQVNCQAIGKTPVLDNVCNPSHPSYDASQCTSEWTGWANTSSCTPSGDPNDPDSIQCRYVLVNDYYNVASCTRNQLPSFPTNGANLPAGTYTNSNPTYCRVVFNSSGFVPASTCTIAEDTQCRYGTWSSFSVGACPSPGETLPTTGTAIGTTYVGPQAIHCVTDWTAYVDLPVGATCTDNATTRCGEAGDPWVDIPYDPDNPPPADPTKRYREFIVSDWSPAATSLPTAGLTTAGTINYAALILSCTEGTDISTGRVTYCNPLVPKPSATLNTPSCTPMDASVAPYGVTIECPTPTTTGPYLNQTTCTPIAPAYSSWTETICAPMDGTSTPDTLADVAEYYWKTDLRDGATFSNCEGALGTGVDVCNNKDADSWQRMQTFTLGLGASGVMQYQAGYKTQTSGDYYSILTGEAGNASAGICSWQTNGGPCNWPKPETNAQTNIDDLWHAAVNGRGTYFSAANPSDVAAGITSALQEVTEKKGALAGVTMVSSDLTAADAGYFQVSFTSGSWTGELEKVSLTRNGDAYDKTTIWSAKGLLDSRAYTTRTIYYYDSSAPDNLRDFTWANIQSGGLDAYFKKPNIGTLSQMCTSGTACLATAAQNAAQGEPLVNFLRGDHSNEGPSNDASKYFRERTSVLGDIVGSQTVYVSVSPWSYADPGYSDFKAANATRAGAVYVGANDGMLHAFDASTGQESWAYVPRFLMKDLFHLADKSYSNNHRYYVDATPMMGDICTANCAPGDLGTPVWKTILVGGANLGGRGYYALDVTNPASPKALWEFSADTPGTITNANLGYTYGNPVITKLGGSDAHAGKWVVIFTSGYNNADGIGHLFVVDASDGTLIRDISTGAGSSSSPSGLSKISAWANYPAFNNTALRVYGGDLLGNVWRFDINDTITPSGYEAQRLATLKDSGGNVQPITARPELSIIKNQAVVFVGTGQLLGSSDLSTTGVQSFYAIKDRLEAGTGADYGDPRQPPNDFVQQSMTTGFSCPAENPYCETGSPMVKLTKNPVDWAVDDGWYVDFPEAGERVNVDFSLVNGVVVLGTNRPQSGACVPAGVSYRYFLDYATGGYVLDNTDGFAGFELGDYLSSAPSVGVDADGKLWWFSQGDGAGVDQGIIPPNDVAGKARRVSWRELIVE